MFQEPIGSRGNSSFYLPFFFFFSTQNTAQTFPSARVCSRTMSKPWGCALIFGSKNPRPVTWLAAAYKHVGDGGSHCHWLEQTGGLGPVPKCTKSNCKKGQNGRSIWCWAPKGGHFIANLRAVASGSTGTLVPVTDLSSVPQVQKKTSVSRRCVFWLTRSKISRILPKFPVFQSTGPVPEQVPEPLEHS